MTRTACRLASVTVPVLAAVASMTGCASTGFVPRPFPVPGAPPPAGSPTAVRDEPRPVDGYAVTGTALSLRGIPYRIGGADPEGFDCSGFTQYVFGRHGVSLPRDVREQYRLGKPVKPNEVSPGDLIFFRTTEPGVSHVAIAVGGDEFVHAPSSSGVVRVEHIGASYWSQRYLGARRVSDTDP